MSKSTHKHPGKRARNQIPGADAAQHQSRMHEIQNKYRPANQVRGAMPINYSGSIDPAVEKHQFKEALKGSGVFAAAGSGQTTNWNVSDSDIDVYKKLSDQAQLRDYHEWVAQSGDMAEPGMLKWFMEMAPGFVESQIDWFESQLDLQKEITMIANFGAQTPRQLYMKYLLDNNKLDYGAAKVDQPYSAGYWAHAPGKNNSWSEWASMFSPARRGEANAHSVQPSNSTSGFAGSVPVTGGGRMFVPPLPNPTQVGNARAPLQAGTQVKTGNPRGLQPIS